MNAPRATLPIHLPAPAPTGLGARRRWAGLASMRCKRLLRHRLPAAAAQVYPPAGLAVHDGDAVRFTVQRHPNHERDAA